MGDGTIQIFQYHEETKHHFDRYARGPGYLDWASQPDPFRRYHGAPLIRLRKIPPDDEISYEAAFHVGTIPPAQFTFDSLSRLLFDSLALSAWKEAGGERWALRVNPSSGNLHPTESYIICGPLPGIGDTATVCHYAPKEHALEIRTRFSEALWKDLTAELPRPCLLFGLASIHWREAWKYGERAFRYCQHDVGHALGAISIAAAGLGWDARLLDSPSTEQLSLLFGTHDQTAAEAEEPDCLIVVYPRREKAGPVLRLDSKTMSLFLSLTWEGRPNRLSTSRRKWQAIDDVTRATTKPETIVSNPLSNTPPIALSTTSHTARALSLRQIIHSRRSAVAMDGTSSIPRDSFYSILRKTVPGHGSIPFLTLSWEPCIHFAIFAHRVQGLPPGLYFLSRKAGKTAEIKAVLQSRFLLQKPEECPNDLDLYCLWQEDVREIAKRVSCFQDIAGDGCFSLGMIADFEGPIHHEGPWFYRRLFWECGMIGQVLYLEAEAAGLRGTGIGCFFDNPMHEILGLQGTRFQDLYHFTIGAAVEDNRLTTLPAYPDMT